MLETNEEKARCTVVVDVIAVNIVVQLSIGMKMKTK